jgi:hypothetical protein
MLQLPNSKKPQSTNPPPISTQPKRPRAKRTRTPAKSALSVIEASIQPIAPEADLFGALCYMKDANDVRGMMGLYEFFAGNAETTLAARNSPLITERAYDFIEFENEQAWAKAYLVADFLKQMRPTRHDVERYSKIMFCVTLEMGNNLSDAVAVVNEIATWDLKPPGDDD